MQTLRVDVGNPGATQRFFDFPFRLYRDNPHWVPPLVSECVSLFGGHPFYEHSEADFYLVENRGEVLGRIGVMHNRNHNAYRKCRTAFFGFFESVEDDRVAQALFSAAFEWARSRGLEEIIGPRGLMGSYGGGILVDGFEHRAALNENFVPPYYDRLVMQAGFYKDRDHLSGYLPGDYVLPERFYHIAERVKARGGFTVQSFRTTQEVRE